MDIVCSESDLMRSFGHAQILGELKTLCIGLAGSRHLTGVKGPRQVNFSKLRPIRRIPKIFGAQVAKCEEIMFERLGVGRIEEGAAEGTHHVRADQIGIAENE